MSGNLVSEDLPEDPVVETEQVLDLGLREATLGGGDVAGHVPHEQMAVPPLELSINRFQQHWASGIFGIDCET